ncbi:MAG TPA: site-specific integrase, partial [Methyloceanibacter sp.]|nr:site-specific integrase [Methyloceanibacter sp.]
MPCRSGACVRGHAHHVSLGHEARRLRHRPTIGVSKPPEPSPRERVLSDDEIAKLWNGLEAALPHSQLVQGIIRLCLLTGQRVGEICGIHARELDRKQHQWTIPAARSKNKHSHVVPLTELGFSLAEQIAAGETMSGQAVATIIGHAQERFEIEHWTAHDLRRTVVTQMARLGVAPIVLGHVINHRSVTKAGVTLSVYSHYGYEREKREALELWAAHLEG